MRITNTRVYKTNNFHRWAKKEKVSDLSLLTAIHQIDSGLTCPDLGGGLLKIRVARKGAGKRGGHRVLLTIKHQDRAFYLFGFSKKDRDNLDENEKTVYKLLAKQYLSLTSKNIAILIKNCKLYEIINEKYESN